MIHILWIFFFIQFFPTDLYGQLVPGATEQQLENLTEAEQAETEDDSYIQQLEQFKRDPLDLNTAGEPDLRELKIISDLQIQHFLTYRKLLGKLISIYELQAIPSWDLNTIRKLLPFVMISSPLSGKEDVSQRLKKGEHSLLLRVSQILEKSTGFKQLVSGKDYPGSAQKIFLRYRYSYKNLLQFGVVGDKDAGEQFFKGAQRSGFDFYSFHLLIKKLGLVQAIALGDFTINMGQGLIQWQSLAFKKSADLITVKRQSPVLRAYNSAGEYNFHRGAAITIRKKNIELTAFASVRSLNANYREDSVNYDGYITSFLTSGNNRTANEIADKNKVRQTTFGGTIKHYASNWNVAVNGIYYQFSLPLHKSNEPYNLFAINGNRWYNFSTDYSYTIRNIHFFGEAALDKNKHKAFINGVLLSVDPHVDLSLLHRHIEKEYQAINANAFTENSAPSNENGLYAGITIRPADAWQCNAYVDIYQFPWLKYLADASGCGRDFLLQFIYTPSRQTEIYLRYRHETRQGNDPDNATVTNYLVGQSKQNLRWQINHSVSKNVVVSNRIELVSYKTERSSPSKGFLSFFDCGYKPLRKPYSGAIRFQYFETDNYNARLYVYENDVLYNNSIPVFYDKGYRYYILFNYKFSKRFSIWARWSQTIYQDKDSIGSGADEISGNKKSEIKFQLRYIL